jgi:hypothetical protein
MYNKTPVSLADAWVIFFISEGGLNEKIVCG